jgi:integrase
VASVWVRMRRTKAGGRRYRVESRFGGRRTRIRYGGSFRTMREATLRRNWVVSELANKRVPDLRLLEAEPERAPTVAEKRETIRKSRGYLAAVLDYAGVDPNPARDRNVKLPKERKAHVPPPLAEHVERVADALAPQYVLPLLVVDECWPRVSELETAQVGDLDEHGRAIRVRWTVEKNERYRHARDHPRVQGDRRPALLAARLRRRRGSLHYKRTGSLAEVAELLGDTKRVAADHYVYALTDYREVDRSIALARLTGANVISASRALKNRLPVRVFSSADRAMTPQSPSPPEFFVCRPAR